MASGTGSGVLGNAVPLLGESTITQQTAATDILTVVGASGQTGDFLVLKDSSGTEIGYVTSAGLGVFAGGVAIKDNSTAPAAADMTVNGQMYVAFSTSCRLYVRQNGTLYYFGALGTVA